MSSVASPRPSITLSSRRTSTSTDTTILSATSKPNTQAAERGSLRRNRTALRDYYNLKKEAENAEAVTPTLDAEQESELDKPGFDPDTYVSNLLSTEGLEGVLRVEAGLVSDIRTLDGEKKALVYDNYSKLITATDTIRSMREKMDPLTPTTSTLTPAIAHIAETASGLTQDLKRAHGGEAAELKTKVEGRRKQQEIVRWVLSAPERFDKMVGDGREEDAREEWKKVGYLLGRWEGVKGVDAVREACVKALDGEKDG